MVGCIEDDYHTPFINTKRFFYMPLRTVNLVERTVLSDKSSVINIPANTATDVFPDERLAEVISEKGEVVYREIFNVGPNNAYYRFGMNCDNVNNFNAYLIPGQMLEVATLERVSVYSAGCQIAVTVLRRRDLVPHLNNLNVITP